MKLVDPLAHAAPRTPARRPRPGRRATASATGSLVDPFAIIDAALETAARRAPSPTYEVQLDPPPGANLVRTTVASQYRAPVPIMWDHATRTAYPIRNEG